VTFDADLLRDDERARKEALDVSRSFIVQAPAGSGKTELLIQRYLKLLATVDDPEEILAITFTRKAAAEMQLRVLEALRTSARGEQPDEAHEIVTADAARDVLRTDQRLGWQLVKNPRRMRILTLDSLNASIARMQPMTASGETAGNAIVEGADIKALYRKAAAATLDWLDENDPMRDATQEILLHVDNNAAIYIAYLARMLETRDQWLPFVRTGPVSAGTSAALRRDFEQGLQFVVADHLGKTHGAFPRECVSGIFELADYATGQLQRSGRADNPICHLQAWQQLPPPTSENLDAWIGLAEFLLTKQCAWRKQVNRNQGFPTGDEGQKRNMRGLLESLRDQAELCQLLHTVRTLPPDRYGDEQWSVLLALFRLLPMAVAELRNLFSARGVTDYIDIAISADKALGSPEDPGDIALLLDYQVRHILVDEMQDTSKAQYRMLEALCGGWQAGDGRTLFCVGDPMQSIYRFRNAEVSQFLLARRDGIGDVELNPLLLRQNFRSGERLVEWFNRVFEAALPQHDDPVSGAVSHSTAVPVARFKGQGVCRIYPLFGSDERTEAETACRIIQDTLAQNPGDSMAVLVRSRTHLAALLPRLRDAAVAYQAVDIDRLTDLPEIIDILALTRAIVHPGDRVAWLAVLRSPWIGLSWTDLHTLAHSDTRSTIWELLSDETRCAKLSVYAQQRLASVRPVFESMLAVRRSRSLRECVEKTWLTLGGTALLDDRHAIENIYRYLDVLDNLEVAGSLPDVAELEAQLDLERVSSHTNARLQIMTMHRAKGLQFDHVLLHGLGRVPRSSERSVLSWFNATDKHGEQLTVISPVGPRADIENDRIHRFIELTEAGKDRHEQGRLLYVACTRARKSLHVLGHAGLSRDRQSFRPADARSLLGLLWASVASEFEQAFDPDKLPAISGGDQAWLTPELRRVDTNWSLPEIAPLPGAGSQSASPQTDQAVDFYWVGSTARIAGTIVHRWLQMAADGRIRLETDSLDALRPVSDRWLREMGLCGDNASAARERAERALQNVLLDEKGQWLLHGPGHAEFALSGLVGGKIESGIIDRVRIDDDGTHWIVDYKTSTHEGGDLAGFLQAESDRYKPQLTRYANLYRNYSGACVRCALYFPLLQKFVEVEV